MTNIVNVSVLFYTWLGGHNKNNTFINFSYINESLFENSTLIRKWHYRAYVNNTGGNPVQNANVSAFNSSKILIENLTTASNGWTEMGSLIEYVNYAGTKSYYSNYTINASASGYNTSSNIRNITLSTNILNDNFQLTAQSTSLSSCTNITTAGTYLLQNGVSNTSTCFNITSSDVTLDCQSYEINGSLGANTYGIVARSSAGNELTNVSISNCILQFWQSGVWFYYVNSSKIFDSNSSNNTAEGFLLSYSNSNNITNVTAESNWDEGIDIDISNNNNVTDSTSVLNLDNGILISRGNYNRIINSTANSNQDNGIELYFGVNESLIINSTINLNGLNGIYFDDNCFKNSIVGNNIRSNNQYGIHLFDSSHNTSIQGNIIFKNANDGLVVQQCDNNTIVNNSITFNYDDGLVLSTSTGNLVENNTLQSNRYYNLHLSTTSDNNTINRNDIWNCSDDSVTGTCIYIAESEYNVFDRNFINYSTSRGVWIMSAGAGDTCNHNLLMNTNMINIEQIPVFIDIQSGSKNLNNTFLNFTYANETVEANSTLVRAWHYRAYVNDSGGSDIPGASVKAFNSTGDLIENLTTAGNGWTNWGFLIEYVNISGTAAYYSNYSVNASKLGYSNASNTHNVTVELNILSDNFQLTAQAGGTDIFDCADITSSGTYLLQNNLTNASTCINISVSDVVFDCQNYRIDGSAGASTYGVLVEEPTGTGALANVSVRNCTISNWDSGMLLSNVNTSTITNITSYGNNEYGIHLKSGSRENLLNVINASFNGGGSENGIYILDSYNNTLSNITASNNDWVGIYLLNSDYNNLTDIFVRDSVDTNIYLYNSSFNNITNITVINSDWGFYVTDGSDGNTFDDVNVSYATSDGFVLENGDNNIITDSFFGWINGFSNSGGVVFYLDSLNNTLKNSRIVYNTYGIYVWKQGQNAPENNRVYNNIFNNSDNYFFYGQGQEENFWNTTPQVATNIIGGPNMGGNYWGQPNGKGDSDKCTDVNADGICDSSLGLENLNTDYLPLAQNPSTAINCSNISAPGIYYLENNITNYGSWHCFVVNVSNVVVDCRNYLVDGVSSTIYYAVYSNGTSAAELTDITTRNCNFTDWINAVNYVYTNGSEISNINVTNSNISIRLNYSDENTVKDSITSNNNDSVYLFNSHDNILTNLNISYSAKRGIYLQNSNQTTITSSRIVNATQFGISLYSSDNNTIYNNIFNNTNNTNFTGTVYANNWNTTLNCSLGPNIINGSCLGGNYWDNLVGTGHSMTCGDGNTDGICDSPLSIAASNEDGHPLTAQADPTITILQPFNTTYGNNSITFNITGSKPLDWVVVEISGSNSSNFTNQSGEWNYLNNTLANGTYQAIFWFNDTTGNMNTDNIWFTIDMAPPQVSFNPTTDSGYTQNNYIFANVTASDSANNVSIVMNFNDSLVNWWRMDEVNASGGAVDFMNRDNGSAINQSAQTNAGFLGKGFAFDGNGDFIETMATNRMDYDQSGSLTIWFKYMGLGWGTNLERINVLVAYVTDSADDGIYSWRVEAGVLTASWKNTTNDWNWINGSTLVNDSQWHFAAFTNNGTGRTRIFVDGVEDTTAFNPGTGDDADWTADSFQVTNDDHHISIGGLNRLSACCWFNGTIDDVMIFGNRTLSPEEVRALYANQSTKYLEHTFASLGDGSHTFKAYAQDQDGNLNSTAQRIVTVDTTKPIITILQPWNTTYDNNSINFNITGNEVLNWSAVQIGNTNHSLTNQSGEWNYLNNTLAAGTYQAIFWFNDTVGNLNSTTIFFTIDATIPFITILQPWNTTYSNNTINFNITSSEMLSWAAVQIGITNHSLTNQSGQWNYLNDSLSDGTYLGIFWFNDTASNMNSTNISFTIDTTLPQITIYQPWNTTYGNNSVSFNVTGSEPLDWINVEINGHNNTNFTNQSGQWNYLNDSLSDGTFQAIFWFNDSIGNTNMSSMWFTVDLTGPVISDLRNVSTTNQNSTISFNCSELCNFSILWTGPLGLAGNISNNTFALFHTPFVDNLTGSSNYSINLTVWDATGNSASNNTFNFTSDPDPLIPNKIRSDFWNLTNSTYDILPDGSYFTRNQLVNASAHWVTNGSILSALIRHNGSGSPMNYTITSPFTGNWTNYTLNFSDTTEFNKAGVVQIDYIYVNASGNVVNFTSPPIWLQLWGNASVTSMSLAQSLMINGTNNTIECYVLDSHSSNPIGGYNVSFYRNNTYLGSNVTNSGGSVFFTYNDNTNGVASYVMKCNITDDASVSYNASSQNEQNASLNVISMSLIPSISSPYVAFGASLDMSANVTSDTSSTVDTVWANITYSNFTDLLTDTVFMNYSSNQTAGNFIYWNYSYMAWQPPRSGNYTISMFVNLTTGGATVTNSTTFKVAFGNLSVAFNHQNYRMLSNQTFNYSLNFSAANGDLYNISATLNSTALNTINISDPGPTKLIGYVLNGSYSSEDWQISTRLVGAARMEITAVPENGSNSSGNAIHEVIQPSINLNKQNLTKGASLGITIYVAGNVSPVESVNMDIGKQFSATFDSAGISYSSTVNESICYAPLVSGNAALISQGSYANCTGDDCNLSINDDAADFWVGISSGGEQWLEIIMNESRVLNELNLLWVANASNVNFSIYYSPTDTGAWTQLFSNMTALATKAWKNNSNFNPFVAKRIKINFTDSGWVKIYELEALSPAGVDGKCYIFTGSYTNVTISGSHFMTSFVNTSAGNASSSSNFLVNFGTPVFYMDYFPSSTVNNTEVVFYADVYAMDGDLRNVSINMTVANNSVLNVTTPITQSFDYIECYNCTLGGGGQLEKFNWSIKSIDVGDTYTLVRVNSTTGRGQSNESTRNVSVVLQDPWDPIISEFHFQYGCSSLQNSITNANLRYDACGWATLVDNITGIREANLSITFPDNTTYTEKVMIKHSSTGNTSHWKLSFATSLPLNLTGEYNTSLSIMDYGNNTVTSNATKNINNTINVTNVYRINITNNYSIYNRGENLTFVAMDINNNTVASINWSINVTINGSENITNSTSNPFPYWVRKDSDGAVSVDLNASGNGNEAVFAKAFTASNSLAPFFVSPTSGSSFPISSVIYSEAGVRNARNERIYYSLDVNLTCPGNKEFVMPIDTPGTYKYTNSLCGAPSSYSTAFTLSAYAWDSYNNSGTGQVSLTTGLSGGTDRNGGGGGGGGAAPPVVSCNCSAWKDSICGIGGCGPNELYQTRECIPSGCNNESQCIAHPVCLLEKDFEFSLSEYNITIQQGLEHKIIIMANNTGEAPIRVNVTAMSECSIANTTDYLDLEVGAYSDVFMSMRIPLNQSEGDCPVTVKLVSVYNEKSKGLKILVRTNDNVIRAYANIDRLGEAEKAINTIAQSGIDVEALMEARDNTRNKMRAVLNSIEEDDLGVFLAEADELEDLVEGLESSVENSMLLSTLFSYRWFIIIGIFEFIFILYLMSQVFVPMAKINRALFKLKRQEKERVQKRKEIEKQYFMGKLAEGAFHKMLIGGQENLLGIRGQIIELENERAAIVKSKLSLRSLFNWLRRKKHTEGQEQQQGQTSEPAKA
jgi:parallel beta-helix repeat protein